MKCDHDYTDIGDGFIRCKLCKEITKSFKLFQRSTTCPVCNGVQENIKFMVDEVCKGCNTKYEGNPSADESSKWYELVEWQEQVQ